MSTQSPFHRLIDDAAIFPPGNAALERAVHDHHRHRLSSYAAMVGPLLVRDVDVAHLPGLIDHPLEIGVIATSGPEELGRAMGRVEDSPLISVSAIEIPVPVGADLLLATKELVAALGSPPVGATLSVELPRVGDDVSTAWITAADEIAAAGFQTKLRTGGVVANAYPDEDELAAVLSVLVLGRHRVKLTAGLHRAVRNTQPGTGFEQHGFLNVLVAVHRLLLGSAAEEAAVALRERDGRALAAIVRSWTDEDIAAVRRIFRGFGSCSVLEPYTDLVDLGLAA